jgi:nicotinamidase-related amidase
MAVGQLLRASDSALIVIDMQERLIAAMPAHEAIVKTTGILLEAAGRIGIPVAVTEQYPKGLGATVAEVAAKIPEHSTRVEKTCFSGCAAIPVSRPQIVLAGMEAHVCVLQTALEFAASGREVFVVADAICSRTEENRQNAIDRMRGAGIVITNTESVLFEWLRDASHPEFRTLSKLIR